MKKLNIKKLLKLVFGLLFTIYAMGEWLVVIFSGWSFTWFGIITNLILFVLGASWLEDIYNEIKEKDNVL